MSTCAPQSSLVDVFMHHMNKSTSPSGEAVSADASPGPDDDTHAN